MIRSVGFSILGTAYALIAMLIGVHGIPSESTYLQTAKQLTSSERALVDGSRTAIIETGLSESYFDAHFKLVRVVNKVSDRRVIWQLEVNGYQTIVTDAFGYYTEGAKRIDTHSVKQTLGHTTEIVKTIPRAQALKLMTSCIGNYSDPSIQLGPVDGTAELFLVAHKKQTLSKREREEREREEAREREREREQRSKKNAGVDQIESEQEDGAPLIIGYINLQTGKCTKGKGLLSP